MAARPEGGSSWQPNASYRKFTAKQKVEIVLAGLRGDRSVKDVCREHEIAETLYYSWRDKLLEGGMAALAGKDERARLKRSSRSESASSSGPWAERPMSSRWRGNCCGAGSERARRPVPRARGAWAQGGGRRQGGPDQPPGDLPHPEATHRPGTEAGHGPGRPGDRRGREAEPDRRHQDGRGAHVQADRQADEPKACPAGDALREAPAAPSPASPAPPTRLLPRHPPRRALAHGHDLGLGRRARLVLPERGDRLLHPRDPGLGP